jgi:hypothetical protein
MTRSKAAEGPRPKAVRQLYMARPFPRDPNWALHRLQSFVEILHHIPAASIRVRYTSVMVGKLGTACTSLAKVTPPAMATVDA